MSELSELKNTINKLEIKINNVEIHHWRVFFHSPDEKIFELEKLNRKLTDAHAKLETIFSTTNTGTI